MIPGTSCIAICLFVSGWWYAWYLHSAQETAVSLFVYSLVGVGITRTFRPWTHTSDDSYIYQLSLVVATATVSFWSSEILSVKHGDIQGLSTQFRVTRRRFEGHEKWIYVRPKIFIVRGGYIPNGRWLESHGPQKECKLRSRQKVCKFMSIAKETKGDEFVAWERKRITDGGRAISVRND